MAQKVNVKGENVKSGKGIPKGFILHTGNVRITQKETKITCDRALQNYKDNTVEATGNVKIFRTSDGSDTPLSGDVLYFNGDNGLARLRDNVYYRDSSISFTTEKFNYNTKSETGYYFDGGIVKDSANTLISDRGYLFKNDDILVKDSVIITTPDYIVHADSIRYNSKKNMVYIIAPTTMYSDSSVLYTERGYYDTDNSYVYLSKNSELHEGSSVITGDTIAYNEKTMIGEGFSNVVINDTAQQMMLLGDYMYHDGSTEYSMITDSARIYMYAGFDTLFARADTFKTFVDTMDLQYMTGYNNVRFFRFDVQGKCDSLVYSMEDSVATLYNQPMLWALYNQMEGEEIRLYNKNNSISHVEMEKNAFLVSREDSIRFNQVKGKTITGYINGNEIDKIEVEGAAESIYYSREGQDIVGFNQTESSYLTINMKDGQVSRLMLRPAAMGTFYPIDQVVYEDQFLRGFQWRSDLRPTSPEDIYRLTPPEDKKAKRRSSRE